MTQIKKFTIISTITSILCLLLFLARYAFTGNITYVFLIWNLILAIVPFIISLMIYFVQKFLKKSKALKSILAISWFFFLPNTFYIITDFVHFKRRPDISIWYDLILLSTFSFVGMFLGFASLKIIHDLFLKNLKKINSALIISGILLLSSYGIYLGRFLRWNSWDVIYNPGNLINDLFESLKYPETYIFTILFTVFLGIIILIGSSFEEKRPNI